MEVEFELSRMLLIHDCSLTAVVCGVIGLSLSLAVDKAGGTVLQVNTDTSGKHIRITSGGY